MKQRTLGTNLTVSEIGLGCMSLTGAYGTTAQTPRAEANALNRKAVELGETARPLPGSNQTPSGSPADAPDPLETQAPQADGNNDAAGEGTWVVWTVFGIVIVTAVGGGVLYVRRRERQGGAEDA